MRSSILAIYTCLTVLNLAVAQLLPDSQALIVHELEHYYFDYTGPAGFKSGIIPCTNYVDSSTGLPDNTLGRQTSAQWLRAAFRRSNFSYTGDR